MALFGKTELSRWVQNAEMIGSLEEQITSVEIDSRQVERGSLFVALPGENTDGHQYVVTAFEKGALLALVSREWAEQQNAQVKGALLVSESPLRVLQDIAEGYLGQFPDLVKIAVTGSNGKTTTKELAGSILTRAGKTLFTKGNLNSDIGLPLTVFRVRQDHRWALFEMGMNRKGEITELARIVKPDLALITNVGTAHVGMLGSREALAREKKEIFSQFKGTQTAIVYEDDDWHDFLLEGVKGEVKDFGPRSCSGFQRADSMGFSGQKLVFDEGELFLRFSGKHNLLNCLAAMALARELGISWQHCKEGIEACEPPFGRSEVLVDKVTLIRDCYNANPDSMIRSLETMAESPAEGRKVLVLGDMGELGAQSAQGHREVLEKAQSMEAEVFTLGKAMKQAAGESGMTDRCFLTYEELEKVLVGFIKPGDLVLLKGSRTLALERLTEPIMNL